MRIPNESTVRWRKSTHSNAQGSCVEVAFADDSVLVRHSKDPGGPRLRFTRDEWLTFVAGVRDGEFLPE